MNEEKSVAIINATLEEVKDGSRCCKGEIKGDIKDLLEVYSTITVEFLKSGVELEQVLTAIKNAVIKYVSKLRGEA